MNGIQIFESVRCVERVQFRFPRSKKQRIRSKWQKREENVRYKPRAFKMNEHTIVCHPAIANRLRADLTTHNQTRI